TRETTGAIPRGSAGRCSRAVRYTRTAYGAVSPRKWARAHFLFRGARAGERDGRGGAGPAGGRVGRAGALGGHLPQGGWADGAPGDGGPRGGCRPRHHRPDVRAPVPQAGPRGLRPVQVPAGGELAGSGAAAPDPAPFRAERGRARAGEDGGAGGRLSGARGRAGLGRRGGDGDRHRRRRAARPLREPRLGEDGLRVGRDRFEGEHEMNPEMIAALRELEREKGIAFETILAGLEEAMASAYKSWWRQQHPELDEDSFGVRASIDPESGDLRVWLQELVEKVGEDGEPVIEVASEKEVEVTDEFKGRIGAQTAKQVIFQKLRDAEREMTYEEFAGREGDVVTGIVQQQERRYTLLDLGKVEALLPQAEQVPFELEVPEIEEGIVEIRAVAREPGHRSKIAVSSKEPGVDPVGACVGPKGSRVRMVVNELRGEKIDVVPWSPDPATFVANALQPAKVKEARVDPATQTAL